MKGIKKKIKKIDKTKALIVVVILLLGVIVINKKSITPVERIKLEEESNSVSENINVIEEKQDLDSCVIYTINYYVSEKGINKISIKDINKYIKNHFNIKTSEKEISKLGITPNMLEERITFNPTENTYEKSTDKKTYADIAGEKIEKYREEKIKKKSNKKFVVIYKKYVVKDPYKILNYYTDMNNKNEKKVTKYNTEEIDKYLKGGESKKTIKKYITEKNIGKIGKEEGKVKITYIIRDGNILIDKIKVEK